MEKQEVKKVKKIKKKIKIHKKAVLITAISLILIAVMVSVCFIFFIPNVKLLGDRVITLKLDDTYEDSGVVATYRGKDVTDEVKIEDNIKYGKVGTYKITYSIKKGIFKTEKKRTIKIIDDIKPEIILEGEEEITLCPGKEFEEIGYKATDNYDGDITKKVEVEETDDKITYTVTDSSGNKTTVSRKIIRSDKEGPKITLKGNSTMYLNKGGTYEEPGYTAVDNCEGDVSDNVEVEGKVDTSKVGTQIITYKVKDKFGNETKITREVYVSSPNGQGGMIYLTFDDGPSNVTDDILDILKKRGVKATFFVINQSDNLNYLIKRAHDEGHTIGLHSYSHQYNVVYRSTNDYFDDLNAISKKVKEITGEESKIIRFPGGGSNTISKKYSLGIMSILTNEVLARGYHYFDWNVDCGDAGGAKTKEQVYNNVVNNLSHNRANVVLMHDFQNNYKTLEALDDIISYGLANGYTFAAIDMNTPLVRHRVNN